MYEYLKAHASQIRDKDIPFLFIDALNCKNGCLCGTATDPEISSTDNALFSLLKIRESVKKDGGESAVSKNLLPEERLAALNKQFENLNLSDYTRSYTNLSKECAVRIPNESELENIFLTMEKDTPESRCINCSSCGYGSCREMAIAIFNGFNHRDNCVHYLKSTVEADHQILIYQARHDDMLDVYNRHYAMEFFPGIVKKWRSYSAMVIDIETRRPVLANRTGGLSGRCVHPAAVKLVYDAHNVTKLPILAMGGIYEAKDAIEFFLAGATAVAVGTATFTDPGVVASVHDGLIAYCERHGFASVSQLTGALA